MAHRFGPIASAALLASAAALTHVPAVGRIVGADERIPVPASLEAQFSGVGRLVCRDPETGDRFSTTATLVGDRSTLLAAGHFGSVRFAGRDVAIGSDFCAFELRSADGKRFFGSLLAPRPVARFSAASVPDPSTPDWAIMKLRTPAPGSAIPAVVRPMSARDISGRRDVFMVSYHSAPEALARTKRYSPGCRPAPAREAPLVFRHSCDTESGSSGGLLFIMTPAGPRAVGINHGSATERDWNYGQVIGSEIARHLPKEGIDSRPF